MSDDQEHAVDAPSVQSVEVIHYPQSQKTADVVAVEEPLEIRVNDTAMAVVMRTPGNEKALVAGFLLTEGIIDDTDDIQAIAPCQDPARPNADNIMLVRLASGSALAEERIERAQRHLYTSSSCGVCGKATIDNLMVATTPHADYISVPISLIDAASKVTRSQQTVFQKTGGLHGASIFEMTNADAPIVVAEDIGRHNAVDKVIGHFVLSDQLPLHNHLLWVSGRAGFEIVQKALVAGISAMVCVGAPSSLAIELAERGRLTLIGFARQSGHFNVYTGTVSG